MARRLGSVCLSMRLDALSPEEQRLRVERRFWVKVEKTSGCWIWKAATIKGYGVFGIGSKVRYAHRVAYELLIGPIPDGLTLDHLCRTPLCVNPAHLEPCTSGVNTLRGNSPSARHARATHCPQAHEFTPENTINGRTGTGRRFRQCRTCKNAFDRTHRYGKEAA